MSNADSLLQQSRESSLRSRRDAMALVLQALEVEPEHSMAHAIRGLYLYGERHQRNQQAVRECAADSARHLAGNRGPALHYCNALTAASQGDATTMVFHLEQQLLAEPNDITALKLCQSELFWLGEMQWSASISASVESHWNIDHPYYGDYLAIRAFDLEETGDYVSAEKLGRDAVAINPADVWGAHAVAHVMYMQGRSDDGARWLDQLHQGGHWEGLGQMVLHLWWHRALFHLLQGEFDTALSVYDDYLRNFELDMVAALPDLYLDLQNASSLLLRLEFLGGDVGDRWMALADICQPRVADTSNAFSCPHYAAVLSAANRFDKAQEIIDHLSEAGKSGGSLAASYSNAALPAAIASVSHRKREYQKVIEVLMPVRHRLVQMGGSHAQREVFLLMLAHALQQENETVLLHRLSEDLAGSGFDEIMADRILQDVH